MLLSLDTNGKKFDFLVRVRLREVLCVTDSRVKEFIDQNDKNQVPISHKQ